MPSKLEHLGSRVRRLRTEHGRTQVELANDMGISASYLNLIENNKRPLPAEHMIWLSNTFEVGLDYFMSTADTELIADIEGIMDDPLLAKYDFARHEARDFAIAHPHLAAALVELYASYARGQKEVDVLAEKMSDAETAGGSHNPSEQVTDFIQDRGNYFDELEERAEALWRKAGLNNESLYTSLQRYLQSEHDVVVTVTPWFKMRNTLRKYEPTKKRLALSELLPTRNRSFQLGHQLCLMEHKRVLDHLVEHPALSGPEAKALARVALANYFAGAVLMPYERFLKAAKETRYDLDVVGRRFRVGLEQVCHRLTTLQRPKSEGVPFHLLRIDIAGNISKRFSASGIRFSRFGGACPKWNVYQAFLTPGMFRVQISTMPDGNDYLAIARTIQRDSADYHSPQPVLAIGLGCRLEHAKELVYADRLNLNDPNSRVPIGISCRLCERTNCSQRAHPSLRQRVSIDENVRRLSLYDQ